jgi:hypothetical protein
VMDLVQLTDDVKGFGVTLAKPGYDATHTAPSCTIDRDQEWGEYKHSYGALLMRGEMPRGTRLRELSVRIYAVRSKIPGMAWPKRVFPIRCAPEWSCR